ncbi:MAG: translation initiation factor IF-2, partial [Pseudomonadota bacterium]|nr:translation initiation factor IF-2 [Pseudomonadota bacterium]
VRKKQTFTKPDPALLVTEAKSMQEQRAQVQAEAKARAEAEAKARAEAEARQQATLDAMRAQHLTPKADSSAKTEVVVVKRGAGKDSKPITPKPVAKPQSSKKETPEQRKAREAEEARLKATEEAARRAAAEEAQQRTLEQMRQMASKYANQDTKAPVIDENAPLARGLVGRAYEESFAKEDREIKRGGTTAATTRGGKGRGRNSRQEEQSFRQNNKGLKTSQSNKHGFEKPVEKQVYDVQIGETIVVSDLAQKMALKVREVIKMLMKMGEMVREGDSVDQATAALVVEELGHNPILVSDTAVEDNLIEAAGKARGDAKPRPPVVTIMGHVDHGKTSLLDYIRRTKVASGEAGGITQHIGAYHVETDKGVITFLDTPGHAAFTSMRARGAKATDIVVIVVAADDGVMPQTAEAIEHARAAGTPIIIAINKMDKEGADIDRVLNDLSVKGITTELWNGDTPAAKISAKTGQGIDELLDLISIQAELMELTASDEGAAQGVVIEARIDKGRGAVASLLVQKGTLQVGDLILAGAFYGRVRAMTDENGQAATSAGPSIPVEILGLPDAPNAGDEFLVVSDEKKAREVAQFRADRERSKKLDRQSDMRLENLFAQMGKQDVPTVNLVLKTDVRGSLEALTNALNDLSIDDVQVRIVGSGVGAITESDVTLAESTRAVLLGFNVRADTAARLKCQQDDVDVRYYSIIYEMIDDVKAAMSGMLAPEHRENILGIAQVRQVFRSSRFGAAAGCMVMEGTIYRNKPIRVLRDGIVVFQGELESLRRHKDDVNEVRAGIECGLGVKGYNDIKELDQIEVYEVQQIKRTL